MNFSPVKSISALSLSQRVSERNNGKGFFLQGQMKKFMHLIHSFPDGSNSQHNTAKPQSFQCKQYIFRGHGTVDLSEFRKPKSFPVKNDRHSRRC